MCTYTFQLFTRKRWGFFYKIFECSTLNILQYLFQMSSLQQSAKHLHAGHRSKRQLLSGSRLQQLYTGSHSKPNSPPAWNRFPYQWNQPHYYHTSANHICAQPCSTSYYYWKQQQQSRLSKYRLVRKIKYVQSLKCLVAFLYECLMQTCNRNLL